MIVLLRWMLGWSEFSIEGNVGAFLNAAKRGVWMVRKQNGIVFARCLNKNYKYICDIAKKKGCCLKKYDSKGLTYILKKYKFRLGLAVGAGIFIFFMFISNFFVCEVEVSGNIQIDDEKIFQVCDKFGLHAGNIVFNIDERQIEFELEKLFPQIAWVSVNRVASKYYIEISEAREKPDIIDKSGPCNVTAAFDGEIISVEPYSGFSLVEAGDFVTKNQLLVSGIQEIENSDEVIYSHADAKIIAKVERNNEIRCQKFITRSQKTGTRQNKKNLLLFCFKIPMDFQRIKENAVKSEESLEPVELFGIRLPIFVQNNIYDIYDETDVDGDFEQIRRMLANDQQKWELKELAGSKIISRSYIFEESDSELILKAKINVEQRIDEKHPIQMQ